MRLSGLQRYILQQLADSREPSLRSNWLTRFYAGTPDQPTPHDRARILARSLDRLIVKALVIGYGKKTAHKWFIQRVRLTTKGRGVARRLSGEQQILPLRLTRRHGNPTAAKNKPT